MYAQQPEIERYLQGVAGKYGLLPHVRFGANVVGARYDEAAALSRVETPDGRKFSGRVLVSGMGALRHPSIPKIPGPSELDRTLFHLSQGDHLYCIIGKRTPLSGPCHNPP